VQYVQRVNRIGPVTRTYWFDLLITAVAIAAMVEIVVGQEREGSGAPTTTLWFSLPAIAILVSPLFARRRFPFAAPAMYWVLAVALSLIDWRLTTFPISLFLAGMAASFLLGNLRNGVESGIGLGVSVAGPALVVATIPDYSTPQMIFIPLQFAISWVAGFALRERSEQAEAAEMRVALVEQERDAAARIAVAEERARIARELHDMVAHAVSVMVLQVGAVRHRHAAALAEDTDTLKAVERAGRTALAEMRRLLAAMRTDDDDVELGPQPGLDALGSLVQDVERAGLPVRVQIDGEPEPLPRALDLSAYRILQEGLTNVLKHAHATSAEVTLRYEPDVLTIQIHDDGHGAATNDGLGHGLVGIRERVKIYGGEMSAAGANGGGFTLETRLPLVGETR
jgi:signal transduction histidine kinase